MKKLCFILAFLSSTLFAQTFQECNINSQPGEECITQVDKLHPGQANVGKYVINMTKPDDGTLAKFIKKCNDNKLTSDLIERGSSSSGIAGVMGPNGVIYLTNGHHHSYALSEIGSDNACKYNKEIYVYIVSNQSKLSNEQFRDYLINNNYVWLYSSSGEKISFDALPSSVQTMGDDPYRSLIKLVEDGSCNEKEPVIDVNNTTPFLQFIWANQLYKIVGNKYGDLKEKNAEEYAIAAYNVIANNYTQFKNFPGAITNYKNYKCTKY